MEPPQGDHLRIRVPAFGRQLVGGGSPGSDDGASEPLDLWLSVVSVESLLHKFISRTRRSCPSSGRSSGGLVMPIPCRDRRALAASAGFEPAQPIGAGGMLDRWSGFWRSAAAIFLLELAGCDRLLGLILAVCDWGIVLPRLGEVVGVGAVELLLDAFERGGERLIAPGLVVADQAAGDAVRPAFGDPAQGRQHRLRLVSLEQQRQLLPQAFFLLICQ
jgi:hypothetical protein